MGRRSLLLWFAVVASSILGAWAVMQWRPVGLLLHCPLRDLTGIPCLTCGGTHAVRALFHLDFATALAKNPLLAVGIILFVLSGILALLVVPWAERIRVAWRPKGKGLAIVFLALIALNWVYLLLFLE